MIYGSVCSGIEAASVAWHPLGWRAAFLSEIEPFPRAVLAHHYPNVPLHGDFTTIQAGEYEPIDLLVGGTPCQSFSIAGLRGGLADERGNLALEFLALAGRLRPRWIVWENVPGVLSSGGGRDFGSFLGGLVELGYGFAYRVLDAQFWGLAQRRKRVFVVGCLGDWRRAWAVLSQPACLQGHSPPRREAGEGATGGAEQRAAVSSGRGWWDDSDVGATIRASDSVTKADTLVATALRARDGAKGVDSDCTDTLVAIPLQEISKRTGVSTDDPRAGIDIGQGGDPMFTLQAGAQHGVAVAFQTRGSNVDLGQDVTGTIGSNADRASGSAPCLAVAAAVRRLTPVECSRLMGFSDTYLDIQFRGRPAADGNKYKALGNSMAVPCMAWIGRRIAAQDAILAAEAQRKQEAA